MSAIIPFDRTTASPSKDGLGKSRRAIQVWLVIVAAFVAALVLVGGATRLTESGLSITEWKPIHGIIPPLSGADWQDEFERYRQIPQYQQFNRGMSLPEFQTIYWWEWTHRFLARTVGIVFALPLAFFWVSGRLERRLKPRLLGLLVLGGMQGAIGWWMVASGLTERTDVSQYRLATHLTTACVILAAILWVARGFSQSKPDAPPTRYSVIPALLIVCLALGQIYLGGLVAGLNAGLAFNTWPLMDGQLVPRGLLAATPGWRNFFENAMTVQFTHRLGAYTLFGITAIHAFAAWRIAPRTVHARVAVMLFALVAGQAALGITTLLLQVPIGWALFHQAGALVVLSTAVIHARALAGAYPVEQTTRS